MPSPFGPQVLRPDLVSWLGQHAGRAAASGSDMNDRNSLQLHLQDLNLDNVDALEGLKLNIQVMTLHIVQMTIREGAAQQPPDQLIPDGPISRHKPLQIYHELWQCEVLQRGSCTQSSLTSMLLQTSATAAFQRSPSLLDYTQNAWHAIQASVCVFNSFCKCFCNSSCPQLRYGSVHV